MRVPLFRGARRTRVGRVARGIAVTVATAGLLAACSSTSESTTPSTSGEIGLARVGPLDSVSCPSTRDCAAISFGPKLAAYFTTDGGSSWSRSQLPASVVGTLVPVSCASTSDCVVVGGRNPFGVAAYTTDGGSSWSLGKLPPGFLVLQSVSCPSTSDCVSGGVRTVGKRLANGLADNVAASVYTTDGGSSWSLGTLPAGWFDFSSVSCPSTSDCVALGGSGNHKGNAMAAAFSTDGGRTWSESALPAGLSELTVTGADGSVACPSTRDCIAVVNQYGSGAAYNDVGVAFTTDGGSSWSEGTLPLGVVELDGVSCLSSTDCVAVGAAGAATTQVAAALFTTDGGSSWSAGTLPAGLDPFASVSCPSTSHCAAVGFRGSGSMGITAAFTTDGGTSWT